VADGFAISDLWHGREISDLKSQISEPERKSWSFEMVVSEI
jgi:hypothetical protein